jgi:hypothetical protein
VLTPILIEHYLSANQVLTLSPAVVLTDTSVIPILIEHYLNVNRVLTLDPAVLLADTSVIPILIEHYLSVNTGSSCFTDGYKCNTNHD